MPPSLVRKWQMTSKSFDSVPRTSRLNRSITDEDLQALTEGLSTLSDTDATDFTPFTDDTRGSYLDESASEPRPESPEDMLAEQERPDIDEANRTSEVEVDSPRVTNVLTQVTSQAQDRKLALLFLALLLCLHVMQALFSFVISFLSSFFFGS